MTKIFFTAQLGGFDPLFNNALWVSDGTQAGTQELAQFAQLSLGPSGFTSMDGNVYLYGRGDAGQSQLWKSDGTVAGTGTVGANTNMPDGEFDLTNVAGMLFFGATDNQLSNTNQVPATGTEAWASNGTVAGTVRLADINSGTGSSNPHGFTDVNGTAFFFATAGAQAQLWKSDGTAAGTALVSDLPNDGGLPIQGGAGDGYNGSSGVVVDLHGQISFQGKFYFADGNALYVSDGTQPGTMSVSGNQLAGSPTYLTGFDLRTSSLDPHNANEPQVVFADGFGGGLWAYGGGNSVYSINPNVQVTDIVESGNSIYFAASHNNVTSLWIAQDFQGWSTDIVQTFSGNPSDLTDAGGGRIYFTASDGTHGVELWKSDSGGTAMVSDINPGAGGSSPVNLVESGGTLYFEAKADGSNYTLWKTDGTTTTQLSTQTVDERVPMALLPDIANAERPRDFNGDHHSDVLIVAGNGAISGLELNGKAVVATASLGQLGGSLVAVLGTGDFNGDGTADLLLGNSADNTNTVSISDIVNGHVVSSNGLGTLAPQIKWQFQGIGDFNGDGVSDILWRDNASQGGTGHFLMWIVSGNGTQVDAQGQDANIGTPTLTANFAGIGDFNGDGRSDILLNDQGTLEIEEMNGTTIIGDGVIGTVPAGLTVKGVGDFNGDGHADILFQAADTTLSTWDLNGSKIVGGGTIGQLAGFTVAGIGDYNNDGKSDILFQNGSGTHYVWLLNDHAILDAGTLVSHGSNDFDGDGHADVLFSGPTTNGSIGFDYEWQMNDRSIANSAPVDLFPTDFSVQATGDFNGDGKSDVLFENPTTAGVWEWQLNGTSIANQGAVDVADPAFHILGAADFNGDGMSDLMWRNDTTGLLYEWRMNGTTDIGAAVGALDSTVWHAVGAGDFTGDGKADILFHYQNAANAADPANGALDIWQMDGSAITATLGVERPDPSWQILGVGDFNGDGISDIAIRNVSATPDNGAVWVYLMAGTITTHADSSKTADILAQGAAGIVDAATWHLQEIGDLNGDGKSDILFRNDAGYFYSWDMNGTTIGSEGLAGTESGSWADPSLHVIGQHWDVV